MASKAFTGLVVAFWVVMMAALVRVELFPSATKLTAVSLQQVLHKLCENNELQSLKVLYQGNEIGLSTVEITPLASPTAKIGDLYTGEPGGYQVKAGLGLDLNVFGTPSKFQLNTDSRFDTRFELKDYRIRSMVGASQVEINGQNQTRKVTMTYDLGEGPRQRQLNYDQLSGPGALEALGLPGLTGIAGLALPANVNGKPGDPMSLQPVVQAYEDHLTIGGISQHTYLIECRTEANPAYWAKIWLDDQGTILIIDTSIGMTMRAQAIDTVADKPPQNPEPYRTRHLQ
jgi:hypothetical protein